ncbi:hypothetical protein F0562_021971 [Nyssa sinensis]|uniref:Uncharacterized protein n=1 Tax=Nyssa sinensis TaxID=561372 RepID=A0A5J5BQ51_9ASTE|nr:hypothetical protein F0562_021971 [Nyssa sinensis]
MDTLVDQGYSGSVNGFDFRHHSIQALSDRNRVNGFNLNHGFTDVPLLSSGTHPGDVSPSLDGSTESNSPEEGDFSDAALKYISQMLMEEEDLERKPCMFQDCLALQVAEKSFYDVLGEQYPPSPNPHLPFIVDQNARSPDDDLSRTGSNQSSTETSNFIESNWIHDPSEFESSFGRSSYVDNSFESILQPFDTSNSLSDAVYGQMDSLVSPIQEKKSTELEEAVKNGRDHSPNGSRGKKNHYREDGDQCHFNGASSNGASRKLPQKPNVGRPRGKKQGNRREVVDLRSLLSQCAQAVSSGDSRTTNELLQRIRQHSSPHGDGGERLAHYFANALEARLAGTGTALYTAFAAKRITAADILKAYKVYVTACPFIKMSNIFANGSIGKLAENATRLHIIDFGILYGYQWPCLIQHLSVRPGGPPKLRITGIDFPQPGFRPAERVEDTGRRLRKYCERFKVPFEYNAIAKKWDTILIEDLKIEKDELLVVNCLYRLKNVPDETVVNCPRDAVLNLIKRINPVLFIHGVVNGTYNAPFFVTRFREALFHYSALFDMFEANVVREDQDRMMFEKEVYGRDVMNAIACEGSERVERPETYKQWHVRNLRAGFKQLPLNQELMKSVRTKVKLDYHQDFVVDEDGSWMLQGWKGRIIFALSCWRPAQDQES